MSNNEGRGSEKRRSEIISTFSERTQLILAIFLITIFFILLISELPSDREMAEKIYVGFIAWIGAIMGFYFGQRPVREMAGQVEEQASKAEAERKNARQAMDETVNLQEVADVTAEIKGLVDENADLKEMLEESVTDTEELFEIIEKLEGTIDKMGGTGE